MKRGVDCQLTGVPNMRRRLSNSGVLRDLLGHLKSAGCVCTPHLAGSYAPSNMTRLQPEASPFGALLRPERLKFGKAVVKA